MARAPWSSRFVAWSYPPPESSADLARRSTGGHGRIGCVSHEDGSWSSAWSCWLEVGRLRRVLVRRLQRAFLLGRRSPPANSSETQHQSAQQADGEAEAEGE